MGEGLPFRSAIFDAAIRYDMRHALTSSRGSVSAIQWLCNADKSCHVPKKRLHRFFQTLYDCLMRGAKAVFQFYPENAEQIEMITSSAMKVGFGGGVVVDYPNSAKAKK